MQASNESLIYKVVARDVWESARKTGVFKGVSIDLQDGYIHFSTRAQVRETVAKHFAGQTDLLIVAVEAESLGEQIKWEPSRGGDLFPHLYDDLHFSSVVWEEDLPLGEACLLYTSPSPRDRQKSRMPSSA